MVGIDAFSQALTNPLLAPRVFNEQTFSPIGMQLIGQTLSLGDVVRRNVPAGPPDYLVRMTARTGSGPGSPASGWMVA
jgi:prostaglandin-endoperoxide synthase 2